MDHVTVTILLLVLALGVFAMEMFVPSAGLLSLIGVSITAVFVFRMFSYGPVWGGIALTGAVIGLPAGAYLAIKNLGRLPMGKLFVPPNPAPAARSAQEAHPALAELIGQQGRALSPLNPGGMCDFSGRRVQCIAECGSIDAGETVLAIGISMTNITVQRVRTEGDRG